MLLPAAEQKNTANSPNSSGVVNCKEGSFSLNNNLVASALDKFKAAALNLSNAEATKLLLGEKEPSMQFTTPEELGELAVFFCSAAGNNIRGVAWNMDGGWAAQ